MNKFYLCFPFVAFLVSCGNSAVKPVDSPVGSQDTVANAVSSDSQQNTTVEKVKFVNYDKILVKINNGDTVEVNKYDEQGRLIYHNTRGYGFMAGESVFVTNTDKYEYNANGDVAKIRSVECQNGEDLGESVTVLSYDDKNRKTLSESATGLKIEYKWDGLKCTEFFDGLKQSLTIYSDEACKKMIKKVDYRSGSDVVNNEHEYDDQEREISTKSFDDGRLFADNTYEFKDNKCEHFITIYNEDGSVKSKRHNSTVIYVPDGTYSKILKEDQLKNEIDDPYNITTKVYDEQGRCIKMSSDNGPVVTYSYEDNRMIEEYDRSDRKNAHVKIETTFLEEYK